MLVTAEWVVPVCGPPIHRGAVLVEGDTVRAVGEAPALAAHPLANVRHDFGQAIITPGLVNAHTHLTLSALSGVVPPQRFDSWISKLVTALRPWDIADHEASGVVGAEECLLAGVTAVGDIAYGAAEVTRAGAAGLGGVFYWELLGMHAEDVDDALVSLRYPAAASGDGRVVYGLSPHSPYTLGPALLTAVADRARRLGVPNAIHVAESSAEIELLVSGTGPLAPTASRTAFGFQPPGTTSVAYLSDLGVLDDATVVHLCHVGAEDFGELATRVRGAVTCPRSNTYLGNPVPDVVGLREAGIPVGLGTDSSASNDDLDLLSEARLLRQLQPELDAVTLLAMATAEGARAIGASGRLGALRAGAFADLVVFGLDAGDEPVEAIIETGGAATLDSVMSAGRWRVRDGRLLSPDPAARARAEAARGRSIDALAAADAS
jgi:aminodeoxyfutalosine deaminase